jgi:hypothetical protein
MIEQFEDIISALLKGKGDQDTFPRVDTTEHFHEERIHGPGMTRALNGAFLIALAGSKHPASARARRFLARVAGPSKWGEIASFYLQGIGLVRQEVKDVCEQSPHFKGRLKGLHEWISNREHLRDPGETAERMWSVFFPEGNGIRGHEQERVEALRAKRTVTLTHVNVSPITNTAREILFTANVLLTIPPAGRPPSELPYSEDIRERISNLIHEPQLYWYDHPIQVGDGAEKNEVLYGLRGLDMAFEFERLRGNLSAHKRALCVLSMSVTHSGLTDIARRCLEEDLKRSVPPKNIDIYVFTEADTRRLIDEVLSPAAMHYLERADAGECLRVFGVDGEYGRHYSFLRAIAAFWSTFIRPEIKATFKIDLDQVFPQKELMAEAGASAFEHLKTPLWGARGLDSRGEPVELGMIAGALVNKHDIGRSLFTADVPYPNRPLTPDEYIFFSILPQALSTEAEMMARYARNDMDGKRRCIQRIHVTGGTTGILVESLRRYRPFTPSFIGRAEDQAYLLSTLLNPGTTLRYVHKDGLVMRHDKGVFAQEAIQSASIAKLVSDYVRILYFSAYARALSKDIEGLKDIIDPFTGCFVSRVPFTVVYLRFALKAASLFAAHQEDEGYEFIATGARRISKALEFVRGGNSPLIQQYERERIGWNLFYDTLSATEGALTRGERFALELRGKAEGIIDQCLLRVGSTWVDKKRD